jgi:hypothetical protein
LRCRTTGRSLQLLLFGCKLLALGARGTLFGLGCESVSLHLADLGKSATIACLVTARVYTGGVAPLRRQHDPGRQKNGCSGDEDDNKNFHARYVPGVSTLETLPVGLASSRRLRERLHRQGPTPLACVCDIVKVGTRAV